MKIRPLHDRIIVKRLEEERKGTSINRLRNPDFFEFLRLSVIRGGF